MDPSVVASVATGILVLADDTIATPLVLGHVSRLLAAVALSTFPNSATTGPTPHDRADHQPVLLREQLVRGNVDTVRDAYRLLEQLEAVWRSRIERFGETLADDPG
jgi:hypothetical protein